MEEGMKRDDNIRLASCLKGDKVTENSDKLSVLLHFPSSSTEALFLRTITNHSILFKLHPCCVY